MQNLVNVEKDVWIRPWDIEKFDELSERDERFFSLVTKGLLSYLNKHLKMYGKPIKHFILNTGSSYLYLENNGYEYTWCETTGEDMLYMETPRCLVSLGNFSIPMDELTSPYITGVYERKSNLEPTKGQYIMYQAEMQRLPIEMMVNLKYVFSNFNESIIFIQEMFEKLVFQKYFSITYLGQIIECSLEIDGNTNIEISQLDLSSQDATRRSIEVELKICTNLPVINTRSGNKASLVMDSMQYKTGFTGHIGNKENDKETHKI